MANKKTVVGFFNRSAGCFPMPLITIVEDTTGFHGVYPSGDHVLLTGSGPVTIEALSSRETFIEYDGIREDESFFNLVSFAFASDKILIGTSDQIVEAVKRESENEKLSQDIRDDLKAFVSAAAEHRFG